MAPGWSQYNPKYAISSLSGHPGYQIIIFKALDLNLDEHVTLLIF